MFSDLICLLSKEPDWRILDSGHQYCESSEVSVDSPPFVRNIHVCAAAA